LREFLEREGLDYARPAQRIGRVSMPPAFVYVSTATPTGLRSRTSVRVRGFGFLIYLQIDLVPERSCSDERRDGTGRDGTDVRSRYACGSPSHLTHLTPPCDSLDQSGIF